MVRKSGNSDAGWQALHDEAGRIAEAYPGKLSKELILSIVEEAEEKVKETDPAAKQVHYRAAAEVFQESWLLYQSLVKDLDINAVQAYCAANPGMLGHDLGAAVYKAACGICPASVLCVINTSVLIPANSGIFLKGEKSRDIRRAKYGKNSRT